MSDYKRNTSKRFYHNANDYFLNCMKVPFLKRNELQTARLSISVGIKNGANFCLRRACF
jgi:hypothetical protein